MVNNIAIDSIGNNKQAYLLTGDSKTGGLINC
jgi:hypothetical protein